jgi:ketosteroid isomerase-like protein
MSQQNVEVVRAAYAAWNERQLEAAMDLVHPDIEVVQDSAIPGAITATGRRAFSAWLESFFETWESFELEPTAIRQVGDRVVVVADIRARGRTTGVPVETQIAHVLTLREGLVARWQSYTNPAEALEAVGLSE